MSPDTSTVEQSSAPSYAKYEHILEQLWKPRESSFEFQIEGVIYHADIKPETPNLRLYITAEIGFMPFTAESAPRRRMLATILSYTEDVPIAKFKINNEGKIVVSGEVLIREADSIEMSFARIIVFIQMTLPYIRVIGAIL